MRHHLLSGCLLIITVLIGLFWDYPDICEHPAICSDDWAKSPHPFRVHKDWSISQKVSVLNSWSLYMAKQLHTQSVSFSAFVGDYGSPSGKVLHVLENGAIWASLLNSSIMARRTSVYTPTGITGGHTPLARTNGDAHARGKAMYIHIINNATLIKVAQKTALETATEV